MSTPEDDNAEFHRLLAIGARKIQRSRELGHFDENRPRQTPEETKEPIVNDTTWKTENGDLKPIVLQERQRPEFVTREGLDARRTVITPEDPVKNLGGKRYMENAKGALVPLEAVKAQDQLRDEVVRKIIAYARDLSAQIARFKGHTFNDIGGLQALIAQEYQVEIGGEKGVTLTSFDGSLRVIVQTADLIEIGPEIQAAKALIDQCLREWSSDSRAEIRALVDRVFEVDKQGSINRAAVFLLLRVDIDDPRWKRAMDAIRDSLQVTGSKQYVRFQERDEGGAWRSITIDLASA